MKRQRTGAALLAALLLASMMGAASAAPFSDVPPGFWAYDAILEADSDGVMTGTGKGVFSPGGTLSMAQFVTVLTRAFYGGEVASSAVNGSWPAQHYDVAERHSLFANLPPWDRSAPVTREAMAQMMVNVMTDCGLEIEGAEGIRAAIPDFAAVDPAMGSAVEACYGLGLITGVDARGSFAPKETVTRAQTAVIYVRLRDTISEVFPAWPGAAQTPARPAQPGGEPVPAETLPNGQPATAANVAALIGEYRNGKEPGAKARAAGFTSYAAGSRYDAYEPYYESGALSALEGVTTYGAECAKLAYAVWDDLFGDLPARRVADFADIRPGDLLHFDGHWSIATQGAFYDREGNLYTTSVDGNAEGAILWLEDAFNYSQLDSGRLLEAFTRYPN